MEKIKAKVIRPFMYNGKMLKKGEVVEFNIERAVNHMRVGDLERNEEAIKKVKEKRRGQAEALLKDAEKDW